MQITIIQYLLSGIIVFVLVQVVIFSEFYTSAVSTAAVISYLMAIFMMIFLSLRFFSWFKLHRNTVVLFYLLSTIMLTINAAFSLALILTISPGIPSLVGESQIAGMTRAIAAKPFAVSLNNGYTATSILSFYPIVVGHRSFAAQSVIRKSVQQQSSLLDKIGNSTNAARNRK